MQYTQIFMYKNFKFYVFLFKNLLTHLHKDTIVCPSNTK